MKFKYLAPNEYNDLTSGFRWIESEYHGPHDFKVHVNRATQKIESVEFDHDGHPEVHGGSDNSPDHCYMVYLHCHNPNHIALMALICNHEDHYAENQVEVVCEKYNMVYQRHEPMALDHTYDFRKCTIDENGIVTYAWWQMEFSWDMLVAQGKSHRNSIKERLRVDIMAQSQIDKANYCIEIIDYVILNEVSKKHPWKVAWPDIHSVSLDNSVPIGLPDGEENGPRQFERTTCWGAVPHDCATHTDVDGEDITIDAICPVSAEEAAILEPWSDLTVDHPSHKEMVDLHNLARESLILSNPTLDLNNDGVISYMEILIAQRNQAQEGNQP